MDKDLSDSGVADEKGGASATVPQLMQGVGPSSTHHEDELERGGAAARPHGRNIGADEGVKQGLESRHLQLMSLAGAIGTGLFLSSGYALADAGPVGMLLGYLFMSFVVVAVVFCMAELSSLAPTTGSYVRHSAMFIDDAAGCSVGWNLVFGSAMSTPATLVSLVVLCQYWNESLNAAIPVTIFMIATILANAFAVRVYGEIEFSFAILKILTVVGLIIFGICIDLGAGPRGERIGFRYWKDPGPFAEYLVEGGIGKFVGFWSVLTSAAYSFVGIESTAIVAAECKNPRTVIPQASKRVFYRVGVIYLASLFVISLIVPSTDENLVAGTGTAATSPFVISAQRAGVNSVASLVNALVILSGFSSGSTGLLNGSRALMGLALDRNAPKFFAKTHKWGVPYYGIILMAAFMPLAYTACSASATTVFYYFVSVSASSALVEWMAICFTSIRLHHGLRRQGIDKARLPFVPWFQPYLAWFGFLSSFLVLLTGGFTIFFKGNFTASGFLSAYAMPILNIIVFVVYKITRRSKFVRSSEMPIEEWLQHWKDHPEDEKSSTHGILQKAKAVFWA